MTNNNLSKKIYDSKLAIHNIIFNHLYDKNENIDKDIEEEFSIYKNSYDYISKNYLKEISESKKELEEFEEREEILNKLNKCDSFLKLRYSKELSKMNDKETLIKKIENIENKLKVIELRINKLRKYCDDFIKLNLSEEIYKVIEEEKKKISKNSKRKK